MHPQPQPQLTLRQLTYFVAAAETGTMVGGSRIAHVSQSAISLAIADLERELGTQLFIRHHATGLSLTPAGRRILARARSVLSGAAALADEARELGESLTGSLTVTCYQTIAPFLIPRLVGSFATLHPDVHLDVAEGDMDTLKDSIRSGVSELMICYDLDVGNDIEVTPLIETQPYVLLPPDHRLVCHDHVELGDLVDDPLVLLDQPQPSKYFLGLFDAAGLQPTIGRRTSSFEMVRSLVARSLGYSLLIQRPASDTSYEGLPLVAIPLHRPARTLTIVVGVPRGARTTRRATAFIQHCRDELGG